MIPSRSIHLVTNDRISFSFGSIVFHHTHTHTHTHTSVIQSCLIHCNPMDYIACQVLSVHGIFKVRILGWVAISSFRGSSLQETNRHLLCLLHWQADSLSLCHLWSPYTHTHTHTHTLTLTYDKFNCESEVKVKFAQSCPTLCDPIDYTVPGIL